MLDSPTIFTGKTAKPFRSKMAGRGRKFVFHGMFIRNAGLRSFRKGKHDRKKEAESRRARDREFMRRRAERLWRAESAG